MGGQARHRTAARAARDGVGLFGAAVERRGRQREDADRHQPCAAAGGAVSTPAHPGADPQHAHRGRPEGTAASDAGRPPGERADVDRLPVAVPAVESCIRRLSENARRSSCGGRVGATPPDAVARPESLHRATGGRDRLHQRHADRR